MMKFDPFNWSLRQRVYATLAYFDIFDLALSAEEVQRYLLGEYENLVQVKAVLNRMVSENIFDGSEFFELYVLKNRGHLFELRKVKKDWADKFRKWSESKSWIFKCVPYLRQVYLCNNLTFDGVTPNSDIDLFVITKAKRLFIARTILTLMMHVLRFRRHGKMVSGRFCLSFYISEEVESMERFLLPGYDLYFAYWMLGLATLFESESDQKFWKCNDWLGRYFENFEARKFAEGRKSVKKFVVKFFEKILDGKFGDFLENILKKVFVGRYEKNKHLLSEKSSVLVTESVLKYHNLDRRADFKLAFEERLKRFRLFD